MPYARLSSCCCVVLFTTELARGAYRASWSAWQTNDLAAPKESGSIEYGVAVLLMLRAVPGADGLIYVTMPKNRLGRQPSFRLAFDFQRATVSEVSLPAKQAAARSPRMGEDLEERILHAVREAPEPLTSMNAICRLVGGTKSNVLEKGKELLSSGKLKKKGKVFVAPTAAKAATSGAHQRRDGSRGERFGHEDQAEERPTDCRPVA